MLRLILAALNSVLAIAALGLLVYSKMIFKRPRITETQEQERVAKLKPVDPTLVPGSIEVDPYTYALEPTSRLLPLGDRTVAQATPHFAKVGMTLVIRDETQKGLFEEIRPILQDKLLQHFHKKKLEDLASVQGRYILRAELIKMINEMTEESYVQQIYFTQFIVN